VSTNDLDAYQVAATRTINPALVDDQRLLDAVAGLAEEAGEALAHVRKHVMQGRSLDRDALAKELGDALWCLAVAARCIEVPLSEIASRNLLKLRQRHPNGFQSP